MDNFKITKTILENINEQNDRINECVDIVNGYTTDEETRVKQELQRQENELRREEQYNNNENRFTEINQQIEQKVNITELNNLRNYNLPEVVRKPVGFNFSDDLEIVKNRGNSYLRNNLEKYKPVKDNPKTVYVSLSRGVDSDNTVVADGSEALPYKSIPKAIQKGADIIIVEEGFYNKDNGNFKPTKDCILKAKEGHNVILGGHNAQLSWSLHDEGYTMYKTSRSATVDVFDMSNLDAEGNYTPLNKVENANVVKTTNNSWYLASDNTLYINTYDGRVPDDNIIVCLNYTAFQIPTGVNVYCKDISFFFGRGFECKANTFFAENCKFNYMTYTSSGNGNGLNVLGTNKTILINCEGSNNYKDGFNYHAFNEVSGEVIEVNCIGRNNGRDTKYNNNGSTAHEDFRVFRLNGFYYGNSGPNCVDIGTCQTWNVNCVAYGSVAPSNEKNNAGFYSADNGILWLDSCFSYNNYRDITNTSTNKIKVKNTLFSSVYGNIENY